MSGSRAKIVHGTVNTYKRHGCRCDACRDARGKEQKAYRSKPEVKARATAYMDRERDRYAGHQRAWRATEKGRQHRIKGQHRREARKVGQFVEDVEPAILFEMWGGMCGVCKQYIDGEFHIDHGVPLSKGGLHGYVNCWPTHPVCNMRKHTAVEVVAL